MSEVAELPVKIFNAEKTDYHIPEIILGDDPGLLDSIHTHYPKLWTLFERLRQLDWAWNEFDFTPCNVEFKTCDPAIYDMMIKTLAWQWEADSIASRSIVGILANVVTDSRVWAGYVRINDNENVHALTYSEIVRNSFDNPDEILDEILAVEEAQARMKAVADVMNRAFRASHEYALGQRPNDQALYNDIFMYFVALYFLERIQFMASFAVTFSISKSGHFQVIGDAVKKIAQDEFEIHSQFGQEVLRQLLRTPRGKAAYEQCKHLIVKLGAEIIFTECDWLQYLFSEGRELTGQTPRKLMNWGLFNGGAAFGFLDVQDDIVAEYGAEFESKYGFPLAYPTANPLPWMQDYMDIAGNQASPQEQDDPGYMVNAMTRVNEKKHFAVDF